MDTTSSNTWSTEIGPSRTTTNTAVYNVTVHTTWRGPADPLAGVREPRRPLPTTDGGRVAAEIEP